MKVLYKKFVLNSKMLRNLSLFASFASNLFQTKINKHKIEFYYQINKISHKKFVFAVKARIRTYKY